MTVEEVTLGELFRSIGKVERAVDDGFKAVNDRFDGLDQRYVSKELYESERDALAEQVKSIGRARRWMVATALAAAAAITDVFYFITHVHS